LPTTSDAQRASQCPATEKASKVELNKTAAMLNMARAKRLQADATLRALEMAKPDEAANDEDALINDALAEARQR
jgi:hypothetical protein